MLLSEALSFQMNGYENSWHWQSVFITASFTLSQNLLCKLLYKFYLCRRTFMLMKISQFGCLTKMLQLLRTSENGVE
ncbi:CLUMA_CG014108, isoform A [Clunio marinus]|uniref:CLUMA_CG014108, isoform A n=1 Tax=Clunio marinus TaxID=568069 RepID=A0A1J1IQU9_9DIPT|nr:CLUMA_CG014108, isoform A [Clunio marinus]